MGKQEVRSGIPSCSYPLLQTVQTPIYETEINDLISYLDSSMDVNVWTSMKPSSTQKGLFMSYLDIFKITRPVLSRLLDFM